MDKSKVDTKELLYERVIKNLKLIRILMGWEQYELANYLRISKQTLNNIENGRSQLSETQFMVICALVDSKVMYNPKLLKVMEVVLQPEDDSKDNTKQVNLLCTDEMVVGPYLGEALSSISKVPIKSALGVISIVNDILINH